MTRHLKTLAMPKTWPIERKKNVWITRPYPCGHPLEFCLPINIIFRDILKITTNTRETKKLIANNEIRIDGRRVKSYKDALGLFDRLYLPKIDKYYTLILNKKNKLKLIELPKEIANIKPLKIKNKKMLKKARIQVTFHDGRTMFADNELKVGDSVLFDIENKKIVKHIPLKKNSFVYIIKGKHVGYTGKFIEKIIKGNRSFAIIEIDKKQIETLLDCIFVIDEKNKELIDKNA
ncbi:MAG: 30S ribosomal protein S4e [Candidatus Pacearchaeota archaeon]